MARAFPEDTAHLIGYGLCDAPHTATSLRSQLLQTYLQRRDSASVSRVMAPVDSLIGTTVDGRYLVDGLLSSHGGYADVYKANSIADGPVALKILRHGQLSVLEREVEVLQSYSHKHIVRFLDSGRLDDGRVYLAMEYLDGETLRAYCEPSTRPTERVLAVWAERLYSVRLLNFTRRTPNCAGCAPQQQLMKNCSDCSVHATGSSTET